MQHISSAEAGDLPVMLEVHGILWNTNVQCFFKAHSNCKFYTFWQLNTADKKLRVSQACS